IGTTRLLKKDAMKSISDLESQLKKSKILYEIEVLEVRSITDSLISYAESHNVDLIVIGSCGLSGFKKLLGSVAGDVSQHSKCPVLIIK
ncbi:MAG: universal stress protein, partial [Nitrosotalea sp.]